MPYHLRRAAGLASFFDGLDLIEPGVVACPRWKPDASGHGASEESPRVLRGGAQALTLLAPRRLPPGGRRSYTQEIAVRASFYAMILRQHA